MSDREIVTTRLIDAPHVSRPQFELTISLTPQGGKTALT